jgi:hypothetical protein
MATIETGLEKEWAISRTLLYKNKFYNLILYTKRSSLETI